jgi:hypothetical protein
MSYFCDSDILDYGFLLFKPHAVKPAILSYANKLFEQKEILVINEGYVSTDDLNPALFEDYIEENTPEISAYDLNLSGGGELIFFNHYGEEWLAALSRGSIVTSRQACNHFGLNSRQLSDAWYRCAKNGREVQLTPDTSCCLIDIFPSVTAKYVINGKFSTARQDFSSGSLVYYMVIGWDASELSWESFMNEIVGAPTLSRSRPNSLRGRIFNSWKYMGFEKEPDMNDNCIYAATSAFQAFADRMNWLGESPEFDPLGSRLLERSIPQNVVGYFRQNPLSTDGRRFFTIIKYFDGETCIEVISALAPGLFKGLLCID